MGCVFDADVAWDGVRSPGRAWDGGPGPYVVTDLHGRPRDRSSLNEVASILSGCCDTVLVGDHAGLRNDFPPSMMAVLLRDAGIRAWVTLSCRDRNRTALAAECAALADLGVAGVLCVTGDWAGNAGGAETKVFDLDSVRLVAMAAEHGLTVGVAASPAAPPLHRRATGLAAKVDAGASVCFVNHCGGPSEVARFVDASVSAGADLAYIACVPVISDARSVASLARLPGLVLDAEVVDRVGTAGGSRQAGVDAARAEADRMLAIPGVVGINLSGSASSISAAVSASMMAELGAQIRSDRSRAATVG